MRGRSRPSNNVIDLSNINTIQADKGKEEDDQVVIRVRINKSPIRPLEEEGVKRNKNL